MQSQPERMRRGLRSRVFILLAAGVALLAPILRGAEETAARGQKAKTLTIPYRIFAEAEDFKVEKGAWKVVPYGENYFANTFAITFLSRMACLGAPGQVAAGQEAVAVQEVNIAKATGYRVLARYEQPYGWSAEFTVEIEQAGKIVYRETFGRLADEKIWGIGGGVQPMARSATGGGDNIVWQQLKSAPLEPGPATIRIIAGPQLDENGKPRVNAAKRHVDLVCLTNDRDGMNWQMGSRTYLPLDGWLVQDGDLFVRVTLPKDAKPCGLHIAPYSFGQCSPWNVHRRNWLYGFNGLGPKAGDESVTIYRNGYLRAPALYNLAGPRHAAVDPKNLAPLLEKGGDLLQPGEPSGWVPVGHLVDALHNSRWRFPCQAVDTVVYPKEGESTPPGKVAYAEWVELPSKGATIEFAVPDGQGGLKTIRKLDPGGEWTKHGWNPHRDNVGVWGAPGASILAVNICLEMPGAVAPNPDVLKALQARGIEPAIRTDWEALSWLLNEIKKFPRKGNGLPPKRFPIYGIMMFTEQNKYERDAQKIPIVRQLAEALGDNTTFYAGDERRRIMYNQKWPVPSPDAFKPDAKYKFVTYGDEAHLPPVVPTDAEVAAWMKEHQIKYDGPVGYTPSRSEPLYYYAQLCAAEKGFKPWIACTEAYKSNGILAAMNYGPHANYLVTEKDNLRAFKLGALSLGWTEDYVWQAPEFSVQVMGYTTSGLRAGAKYHHTPILMYVMPHSPGNTPRDFRLSFYTCIAHGASAIHYFSAMPLCVGHTENWVRTDDLPMWKAIHDCTHEAGIFENYVLDGQVRPAKAGLLLSSVDDIRAGVGNFTFSMHNNERKAIYYALRHAQVPVDFLSEDDVIEGLAGDYQVIYVTEKWLHSRAVEALGKWVRDGGTLVALCGGGFYDEFDQANPQANALYGVAAQKVADDPRLLEILTKADLPFLTKQDLPLYEPFDYVSWGEGDRKVERAGVMVWKQALKVGDGKVIGAFQDGKPAVVEKKQGKGRTVLFGFLPGQAYLKSGLRVIPYDRGWNDESAAHYLPTTMDPQLRRALVDDFLPAGFVRPVACSEPLVETTCIDTEKPAKRLAVPLMNYTGKPISQLTVTIPGLARAAGVRSVEHEKVAYAFKDGGLTVTLPLEVADMLLIDR